MYNTIAIFTPLVSYAVSICFSLTLSLPPSLSSSLPSSFSSFLPSTLPPSLPPHPTEPDVPGMPTEDELIAHYKQHSGVDFSERELRYAKTVICLRFISAFQVRRY